MIQQQPEQQSQETKTSDQLQQEFDALDTESKIGALIEEYELELKNFNKLTPRLSKKQLDRVLMFALKYPFKQTSLQADEMERYMGNLAAKIEHLKLLIVKFTHELDITERSNNVESTKTEA